MNRVLIKYLVFCILVVLYCSCKRSTDALIISIDIPPVDSLNLYGSYDTFIYNNENVIITIGTLSFSRLDSITTVATEGFTNVIDTLGVANYLPDNIYTCKIMNDSLEFVTKYLPNFGIFLIKGYYSYNKISGAWELWGHLRLEQTGSFEALKTE